MQKSVNPFNPSLFLFLQIIVVDLTEGGGFLVFGDATFEEVLFFFDVHHFGKPGEGVAAAFVERG
jgi:hypothetical protein